MRFSIRPSHLNNQGSRHLVSRHLTLWSVLLVLGVAVSGLTWGRLGATSSAEPETHRMRTNGTSFAPAPVKPSNGANLPSTVAVLMPPTITTVNAGPDVDAANNDYRRIQNALNAAASGDTIILNGTFDFTQPFAAAAWALGNDNTPSTADDYEVLAPGVSNVTLTANSPGAATIQGPGDLAAVNLEAFLVFDSSISGPSPGWTISNLRILDFDLSIGMFAVGVSDYNNNTIQNNFIRIPTDLNATVAPADVNQNIGINFSFGKNQTISGNTFNIPGDGVSDTGSGNFSSTVVMQSNISGGNVYDGLTISNNVIHVLNAQSANPEVILGIWENANAHTSNITISNNSFINDAAGNNPALNLQRAFRVTSHSGASSLVKYDSNTVNGANIGFQWITGSNFAGNQAVVLTGNQITNSDTGVLVQSNGIAHFENNTITGSGSGGGIHLITGMLTGSPAAFPANLNSVYRTFVSAGSGDGLLIDATAGSVSQLSQNDLSGNTGFGLHNLSAPTIIAENNWWGNNLAANVAAKVSGNADFDHWLASGTDVSAALGFQPFTYATTSGTITTFVGTAGADTGSLLAGNPVTMTMNGDTATTPLAQLLNFDIQLGASDDVFTLGQTGIPTTFDGGPGNDTLVGTNVAQTWNITGANSGNIPGATSSFTNVESLRGGTAADSFVFGAAGSLGQTIDGKLGADTLDNSAIPGRTITPAGPGTLDGFKGTATGVGVGFDNINAFSPSPSSVSGTKTVSGTFAPNGSITYTVVLSNSSAFAQLDNPGKEFTDTLPSGLTLVSATATSGTAVANVGANTATWNGSIAGGGSVTITITATINSNAGGTTISNQGTINYDADGNGTNESSRLTDDPSTGAANDPTSFTVCSVNPVVTTNADGGAGSLRQAIIDSCDGATISFDMSQVVSPITLTTAELLIKKNLTITGPGANLLTVMRSTAGGTSNFRIFEIQNGFTVNISGLTVSNGNLPGSSIGGGIFNSGTLTLTNSTLSGNTAKFGSGIYNGGTLLTLTNSTVSGNSATLEGGGIFINAGTLTLTNSTVSGNTAPSEGGGIFNNGATVTLTNSTVSGNSATSNGGGIFNNGGTANLKNTIVAGNFQGASPSTTAGDINGPVDASSSFNLIGTGGAGGLTNGFNNNQVGVADARLGPLANNGGPTMTHALLAGSPALDAGSNAFITNPPFNGPPFTDQRGTGSDRIVDGPDADTTATVDVGAFEAQVSVEAITDKTTNEDTLLQFTFNVGGAASITSVTATSSNTALVPNNAANIAVSGSGSTRTLTINPAANANTPANGTATITLTVNGANSQSMTDTFVLTVNPVADTPSVTNATTTVNTQTGSGLVISRNPVDGTEVTNLKITSITGGTLFKNNGATQINNNDFITFAEGNAGLKFTPALNSNANGSFQVQASLSNTNAGLGGGLATATITVNCGPTVVTNSNDSGAGSLRSTISALCAGNVLTFDTTPGQVTSPINLTSGELLIDRALTIQGPGANLLTVSGNNNSRVFNVNVASPGVVTFLGLTISNGKAQDSSGGGINNNNTGTINVTNSTISGNSSPGFGVGGGIGNNTGNINVTNSTISGNSARFGGGIENNNTGAIIVTNSTLSGNSASQGGGGIFNFDANGAINVTNSTLSGNSAGGFGGGGIYNWDIGPVRLRNDIVALNTASNGPDLIGTMTSQGHNLIGKSDSSTGFTNGTNGDFVGTIAAPINPLLGSLANNGGAPQTMALLPGSSAINAGDNCVTQAAHCGDSFLSQLITDERGFARLNNTTVDIGAFESRGFTISATSGTPQSSIITAPFSAPLVATVSSAFSEPVSGGVVTFTAPSSGASATFTGGGSTFNAPINGSGQTSAAPTANSTAGGPYNVTANGSGIASSASFSLTNTAFPSLSINDVSITEGDTGTKTLTFTVTLSAASSLSANVNFATANGTATAPTDYVATNGTLTFNPGDLTKTIPVTINGNTKFEPDKTFTVNLSSPTNATISRATGTGTILNDDAQGGFISFSSSMYTVNEVDGFVTLTVNRTNDVSRAATVDYATDDTGAPANCATVNGLASSRCDFTTALGTLRFAAGETSKTFTVLVNRDAYVEGPETFTVNLSNLTGGAVFITPSQAMVTITDSAAGPPANLIDDSSFFVRQHYHDFLNREPDAAGLAFWTNQITSCGADAQCIAIKRINVSAAFFLSIEFQQTGNLVRSFYVAALDRPMTNNMPGFVEFERDTQALQRGVIVGQGNWQQTLNDNRTAFMNDFVMRAEFIGLYPTTDTPAQYVDKLYLHAGITASSSERSNAIAEFGGATTAADPSARDRALLDVTQNAGFQTREMNRSFVQMEYLGYLRRNPNDAPDGNFAGYNFWLNKLNAAGGNYVSSEMVKAFLVSSEYRRRVGSN